MTGFGREDPAVRDGIHRMLELRARHIDEAGEVMGWKLGFGAPAWLERFGLSGPLVGFLPESNRHPSGSTVSCRGWLRPVAEPEIAAYMARDVDDPDQVSESVAALGPAIELADIDSPPEDIGDVLAGNIFHRAVVLGEPDPSHPGAVVDGLRALVSVNGVEVADLTDLETLTGEVGSILRHTAGLLLEAGERLSAGDVVIMGSVVPPIQLEPGDEVTFELRPMAPISVTT